jgi:arylsulfatase A-like enzyme
MKALFPAFFAPAFLLGLCAASPLHSAPYRPPNIIFILADDLGYGDVRCLNPGGKIATPHLDRIAQEGMTFTDGHSSSSVCTPTRYALMTGRYNWRSSLKAGVLWGFSPRLIEEGRLTVAQMLKNRGYQTACIGKWHLGMDFPLQNGGFAKSVQDAKQVDWSQPIQNGPLAVGFDEYFGISASLDMPPWTYLKDQKATVPPDHEANLWKGRPGPAVTGWSMEDVLPEFTKRAVDYVTRAAKGDRPFFLYLPLNAPHTPIAPSKEWKGKSGINDYADFVMETDWSVGQVLDALEKAGVTNNTAVFVSSDNGCSPSAEFGQLAQHGHHPSAQFRGHKADIFDGGHRVPLLVRWPDQIPPNAKYEHPVCLVDFMATAAAMAGATLPENAAEDSVNLLPALTAQTRDPLHDAVVHHSANGSFAIRQGPWKLELCSSSGGWSKPTPGSPEALSLPARQLYHMRDDVSETHNVAEQNPEIVEKLTALLQKMIDDGRSTPGAPQPNTGEVKINDPGRTPSQKKKVKP